jgi:hypothetical protein
VSRPVDAGRLRDPEVLKELCAAAGIEFPDEDIPALAEALANHHAAMERLRGLPIQTVELSGWFDPRWR